MNSLNLRDMLRMTAASSAVLVALLAGAPASSATSTADDAAVMRSMSRRFNEFIGFLLDGDARGTAPRADSDSAGYR
ncbi:hypothetical protein A8F03_21150, partial [Burkholderia cenocepacia]